jgi:hypothetical protein
MSIIIFTRRKNKMSERFRSTFPNGRAEKSSDWCHKCGNRGEMYFFVFTMPKNAEHSKEDANGGFFRICEYCIRDFALRIQWERNKET